MATYLELVKKLASKSGSMDEDAIATVVGLTGRSRKIANWINEAYTNIQNWRRDWGWLTQDFTYDLLPGTNVYTPASFSLTRFATWSGDKDWYMPLTLFDPLLGDSDEHEIAQVGYQYWKTKWDRGDQTDWDRPIEWALTPKNEIVFGPTPDQTYTVRGTYVKGPQTLAANGDIPEMPERFHQLIVWEGLRLMMLDDGAYQEASFPTVEMATLRHELDIDQLPEVTIP